MPFQTVTTPAMADHPAPSSSPPPLSGRAAARVIPADAVVDMLPATDGWPLRRFTRAAPPGAAPRGTILFLGGRGDFFEKYLEALAHWHDSGWHVVSVDWRGQGGSGRLSPDRHVGHAEDFGVWLADLAHVYADVVANSPAPHVVISHSMGGHLTLRSLAGAGIAPAAAVLVAPMLGFTAPYPDWLGLRVAQLMVRLRGAKVAAWKESEKPGTHMRLRQLLLTHDPDRYQDELWWHEQNPALKLGPASWGWVRAAYASFLDQGRAGVMEAVTTPLLLLSAQKDALVSAAATRRDAQRLRTASFHQYGAGAAHELLREADPIRNDALRRIDAFLEQKAPRA
jgi:lysophospholipase